ncbi:MAG: hypothetical protein DWQ07_06260 [Chloroflexi bacterium]|nr:MAG: hypothetical protein DWQ07_06260 [Chloroflexota bacterium]MBL1195967.1 hypothetical protein [Chloroflexota bacterium]NOH13261.1 hypothetical protein [Chloroflexota bacterium]
MKPNNISKTIILFSILPLLLLACNNATPEAPTNTDIPASVTPVLPSDTPEPTGTATTTNTPEPTATHTPEPVAITVDQNAICRTGPNPDYQIVSYLNPGQTGVAQGQNEDGSWWWVQVENLEESCWISDVVVSTTGETEALAYITPPPAPPSSTPAPAYVIYYLIIEDTGGPFGCGDTMYPVSAGKFRSGDLEKDLKAAFNALLSNKEQYFNELYNALYKSSVGLDGVIVNNDNSVEVRLVGNFDTKSQGGDGPDCERRRISDQLWQTVYQFPEITHADIRWNGGPVEDRLYAP